MVTYVSDTDEKKYLIFGGTFDPVHLGHMRIAQYACDQFGFSRCYFLPNALPAGGYKQTHATVAERKHMLLCSLNDYDPRFYLDDRELKRGEDSYTYQTLAELRRELGDQVRIFWLMGSDAFNQLSGWHAWERLFTQTNFIVVTRPEHPFRPATALRTYYGKHMIQDKHVFLQQRQGAIYLVQDMQIAISSTAIRQTMHQATHSNKVIHKNKATDYRAAHLTTHLPAQVYHYIVRKKLYQ